MASTNRESRSVQVLVNGASHEIPRETSVTGLLQILGVPQVGTAVELEGRILSGSQLEQTRLQGGERIELVRLVGGG